MATEQNLPFSVVSMVEDVLQQHSGRLSDVSRMAEEDSLRRNEAARWLRKTVGVVLGKDLPAEPSEEAFRIGLRSGIILCNALNKIQPGSVPKVVSTANDSVLIPDGAALTAYQYFENVRNFLAAVEEMGLPTFEAADLEQGGKSSRVVDCVLALKSYAETKLGGKNGSWKSGGGIGNAKPPISGKPITRKNSEPFMKSLWTSFGDRDGCPSDHFSSSRSDPGQDDSNERGSNPSLNLLVREYLADKKHEDISIVVESLLSKVMEEFERRLLLQQETFKTTQENKASSEAEYSISKAASDDEETEEKEEAQDLQVKQEECHTEKCNGDEESSPSSQNLKQHESVHEECSDEKDNGDEESSSSKQNLKQQELVQQQCKSIQELKTIIHQTKSGMQILQKKYEEEFISLSKHLHSVASAASGYQRALAENRKLYNLVQDLKGNIRVYCRVRPFLGGHPNHHSSVSNVEEGSISIITPSKYGKEGKKTFNFNRVFGPTATQSEVFSDTQPLIRSVLDGYNVCIFAYGQTGSGKTHTMSGPEDLNEETIGVNYRALRDLFHISEERKDTVSYEISVQMLEIYNEQVRDLLVTDGGATNKRLEIRNSSHNGINVPDANLVPVSSTSDVINLMNLGHKNRAVGSTAMNDRSSRSHSCLTVHVQGKNLTSGSIIRGSMHLVDLAGSERADKTEAKGDRLKEAQHINKSLSALGDVISSLASKSAHVPYRNSKLTQLLQDSLGGQAKTLMFVHISPGPDAVGETLSTLNFAERVSTVELGAAKVNKHGSGPSGDVKELKEQIASLKSALGRKDGEAEHFPQSASTSPEIPRLKSYPSSPIHPSWAASGNRKPPTDDSSILEGQKNAASKLKRRSLDLHDMYKSSPPWPHVVGSQGVNGGKEKEDDKELLSGDWVDKIVVNNGNESLTSDDSLVGQWEAESQQISPMLSPTFLSDPSKVTLPDKKDGPDSEDLHRSRSETATTDDSDHDVDFAATSDSSESDLNLQQRVPKATPGLSKGSKAKKTTTKPKPTRIPEPRSMIPSLIPTPTTRKLYSAVVSQGQSAAPPRKHPGPSDVRRRTGNAK